MNVLFRDSFLKDLQNIKQKSILYRIKELIVRIEKAEDVRTIPNLKKLKGGKHYYRIRLGEYRIGLTITDDAVTFVRCLSRKEIYRYFP